MNRDFYNRAFCFEKAVSMSRVTHRRDGRKQVTLCVPLQDNGKIDYDQMNREAEKRFCEMTTPTIKELEGK